MWVVTKNWIDACRCPTSGGFTSAQMKVLRKAGFGPLISPDGKMESGWISRILGQQIPDDLAREFYEARVKFKAKTLKRHAKKEAEKENLDLF